MNIMEAFKMSAFSATFYSSLEHLQEFPKHSPNPLIFSKIEKTHVQQPLIPPPNLLAFGKKMTQGA